MATASPVGTWVVKVIGPTGWVGKTTAPDQPTARALRDAAKAEWPDATVQILTWK